MNKEIIQLREVVAKLVPLLAGKGLTVTQRGGSAYVKADPITRKPVQVNIPNIPDNAEPSFVRAIQGFIDHEVAHVLITDFKIYGSGVSAQNAHDPKVRRLMHLHNIVEDTMIEREMVKKFPGSQKNIHDLREHFIAKIAKPAIAAAKTPEEEFEYLLVPVMRALAGHVEFQEFLDAEKLWDRPLVKELVDKLSPATKSRLPKLNSTAETLEVARELEAILYPPKPPAPQSCDDELCDEDAGGASQDKPDQKAGEGDGDGERNHSDNEPGDEEDAGGGENSAGGGDDDQEDDEAGGDENDDVVDADDADDDEGEDGDSQDQAEDDGDEESSDEGSGQEEDEDSGAENDDGAQEDDRGDDDGSPDEDDVQEGDDDGDDADQDDSAGGESESGEDDSDGEQNGAAPNQPGDRLAIQTDDHDAADIDAAEESEDSGGGGIGNGLSKSLFDFDDDAFAEADTSSRMAVLILNEAVDALAGSDYNVYTRDFDRIEPLKTPASIDSDWVPRIEELTRSMTGKMQKDIERMMASQSHIIRTPGYRSGRLHGANLHRLVTNDDRIFTRRQEHKSKDTAVTLLIDNSGSMSGAKMTTAMIAGYALSTTLERVKIANEVIGFTTGDYGNTPRSVLEAMNQEVYGAMAKGYRWHRTTPIMMPIYKSFDERVTAEVKKRVAYMAYAQIGMGANVDGESLLYAAERLMKRTEKRKVMLVLSDGQPSGGANVAPHLKRTVVDLTKAGIDLVGIGIMDYSVQRFYPHYMVLNDVEELPGMVMNQLKAILTS